MNEEQLTEMGRLTIDTATRTINRVVFAMRKSPVKCQMSNVKCSPRGFTLVEMTVSIGLFIIIMFIATSAFLTIVNTDRKARAVRIASDNLNIALEDMSRRIKTGASYYCGYSTILLETADCVPPASPGTAFSFDYNDKISTTRYTYKKGVGVTCGTGFVGGQGCLLRNNVLATSPEIDIKDLKFIVYGSLVGASDNRQPVVIILINGTVGTGAVTTSFNIQTTVTQRAYDNQ